MLLHLFSTWGIHMTKAHNRVLVPAETVEGTRLCHELIHRRLKAIATDMMKHYGPYEGDQNAVPLCVGVQFGAMFIQPALLTCFNADFPTYIGTIRAKSYRKNGIRSPVEITNPCFDCDVKGRKVLIIDDIVESGQTLLEVRKWFLNQGVDDVRTFALLDKPDKRVSDVVVDWVGFHLKPDQWVVGMGLDDNGLFRHFNNIVTLRDPRPDHLNTRKHHRSSSRDVSADHPSPGFVSSPRKPR